MEIDKEKLVLNVVRLVGYYQKLTENAELKGHPNFLWDLGLFLAQKLLHIIKSDSPNISELKILVKVLEQDFGIFGSGWCDLYWQAKHFLDSIEPKPENG